MVCSPPKGGLQDETGLGRGKEGLDSSCLGHVDPTLGQKQSRVRQEGRLPHTVGVPNAGG